MIFDSSSFWLFDEPKSTPRGFRAQCESDSCGAGFSLWGFVLARTKPHRLEPAPLAWLAPGKRSWHVLHRSGTLLAITARNVRLGAGI